MFLAIPRRPDPPPAVRSWSASDSALPRSPLNRSLSALSITTQATTDRPSKLNLQLGTELEHVLAEILHTNRSPIPTRNAATGQFSS